MYATYDRDMGLHLVDRCDNCRSSLLNENSESKGIRKIKNYFCETAPEIQLWNALEFIYGVSWESFQNYQLEKNSCLLNSQEDVKFCTNCASLLFENYNAHQNFENACHPSSPVELLRAFCIERTNRPSTPSEKSLQNSPVHTQSESTNEKNTESDSQDDLFDDFAFEEAEDDEISSQSSTETKYNPIAANSIDTSPISHESASKTSNEQTVVSKRATLRPREVVIKTEELSPEEILQFKNKAERKRRLRKEKKSKNKKQKDFSQIEEETVVADHGSLDVPDEKDVRKYICHECGKSFKYKQNFHAHVKCHNDVKEEEPFTCDVCNDGKTFKHSLGLYKHKKRMHSDRKNVDKKLSEAEFKEKVTKALEKITDTSKFTKIVISGRYVCNVCGKSFAEYSNLKYRHWPIHNGNAKKYVCDICGKSTGRIGELKMHKLRMHGTEEEKSKWKTTCDLCNAVVYKYQLTQHIANSHPETPQEKYKCEKCGAEYKTKQSYRHHILTHIQEPQQCDVCNKMYASSKSLEFHKQTVHGEKQFSCDKCSLKFVNITRLRDHEVTHQDVRQHVCDECGKSFKFRQHFYKHLKCHKDMQEKGEGGFTCDLCNDGKTFKHSFSLNQHKKRIHSDRAATKIHQCSFCGKRLSSPHVLRIHENMHKEMPGFKPRGRQKLPGHLSAFTNSEDENETSNFPASTSQNIIYT